MWASSPAVGAAKSPLLCPWPSTPEFMPTYKASEPIMSLPPCAEDALLPPSFGLPEEIEMEAALWDLAWSQSQMCWPEDQNSLFENSLFDAASQDHSSLFKNSSFDAAPQNQSSLFENGLFDAPLQDPTAALPERVGSAAWAHESWPGEPWPDAVPERAAILPRQCKQSDATSDLPRTTLMLKNMPNNQTRKMLIEMLDREGFALCYDFVYLPYDFKTGASLGYAFVNFLTPDAALRAFQGFDGYCRWTIPSRKVCGVGWSEPHQGLEAHIERYRDSPVMHHDVPEKFKPLILKNGMSVPFPPPTKKLRAPRLRAL